MGPCRHGLAARDAAQKATPILDTLAHELSHLAQTRASHDAAPLWLQEGVARIEESRWRPPRPFDDLPSADDLSAFGFAKHVGPDIDRIGPSIAMLSSAMEAQVTYAKVMSFMRFWSREVGEGAFSKLLAKMAEAESGDDVERSIEAVSGTSFAEWQARWQKDVALHAKELPDELRPDAPPDKNLAETRKRMRLGELFAKRDHADASKKELARAFELEPHEAVVRSSLATFLHDRGEDDDEKKLVVKVEDLHANDARWWVMRALLLPDETANAFEVALGLDPLDPAVACESAHGKETPNDPPRKALCEAARARPRE